MSTPIEKVNGKFDKLADRAKDEAGKVVGKIVDSANDVAHAAAEKARLQALKTGDKVIDAGVKIKNLAK